jgi:hypothetical protein
MSLRRHTKSNIEALNPERPYPTIKGTDINIARKWRPRTRVHGQPGLSNSQM